MEENGSGMSNVPTEINPEHPGVARNNEDNRLHPMSDSTNKVHYNLTSTSSMESSGGMALNRALFSYLMPIVMMWFGNTVSDWMQ